MPIDIREHQDAYEFFTRLQVCGRMKDCTNVATYVQTVQNVLAFG